MIRNLILKNQFRQEVFTADDLQTDNSEGLGEGLKAFLYSLVDAYILVMLGGVLSKEDFEKIPSHLTMNFIKEGFPS